MWCLGDSYSTLSPTNASPEFSAPFPFTPPLNTPQQRLPSLMAAFVFVLSLCSLGAMAWSAPPPKGWMGPFFEPNPLLFPPRVFKHAREMRLSGFSCLHPPIPFFQPPPKALPGTLLLDRKSRASRSFFLLTGDSEWSLSFHFIFQSRDRCAKFWMGFSTEAARRAALRPACQTRSVVASAGFFFCDAPEACARLFRSCYFPGFRHLFGGVGTDPPRFSLPRTLSLEFFFFHPRARTHRGSQWNSLHQIFFKKPFCFFSLGGIGLVLFQRLLLSPPLDFLMPRRPAFPEMFQFVIYSPPFRYAGRPGNFF